MKAEISTILRPLKIAFFVSPGSSTGFKKAIELSSFCWAGTYFPIIPLYRRFPVAFQKRYGGLYKGVDAYYSGLIENYDPDIVVYSDEFMEADIRKYINHRKALPLSEFEQSQATLEPKYAIGIHEILYNLRDVEFKFKRQDTKKLGVYNIRTQDLFLTAFFGRLSDTIVTRVLENFPPELKENVDVRTNNWLVERNTFGKGWLSLGKRNTSSSRHMLWSGQVAIFILDPNSYWDIIDFWNLRALGWTILPVPINSEDTAEFRSYIKNFFDENDIFLEVFNHITILNGSNLQSRDYDLTVSTLEQVRVALGIARTFSHQHWFPRTWFEKEFLSYDKALCSTIFSKSEFNKIIFRDELIDFKVVLPEFKLLHFRHATPRFKNEVSLDFEDYSGEYAEVIPADISPREIGWLIGGLSMDSWRFSETGSFYLAHERDTHISINLPYSNGVFKAWSKTNKLELTITDNGKLARNLLKKIEGIHGTRIFANKKFVEFLSSFEGGRAVNQNEYFSKLHQFVKSYGNHSVTSFSELLVKKHIVQLGVTIQCTYCQRNSFHTLTSFDYKISCPNCLNNFEAPSYNPKALVWSYRGRGIFAQDNKANGLITQILLLRFFKFVIRGSISHQFNFKLKNNAIEYEVDVALFYKQFQHSIQKSDFLLSECKTFKRFDKKDIDRMEELGKKFPGAILVFATLNDGLDDRELRLLRGLTNRFRRGFGSRPVNPVMILTSHELLQHDIFHALDNLQQLVIEHQRFKDGLHHYCDLTQQRYLGLESWESNLMGRIQRKRARQ